mgnify:CR=1 FL=1
MEEINTRLDERNVDGKLTRGNPVGIEGMGYHPKGRKQAIESKTVLCHQRHNPRLSRL